MSVCSERNIVAGKTAQQIEALPQNPHQSQGKDQFSHLFSGLYTCDGMYVPHIHTLCVQIYNRILENYTRQMMFIGLLKNNREPVLYRQ